jgi:hypothetical protein
MRVVCLFVFVFFLVAGINGNIKDATAKIDTKLLAFYDSHAPEEEVSFLAVLEVYPTQSFSFLQVFKLTEKLIELCRQKQTLSLQSAERLVR